MRQLPNNVKHLLGLELINDGSKLSLPASNTRCKVNGKDFNGNQLALHLDDTLFSKHLLFLGNIGTGKTNAISQIVSQIKSQLTENDLMIIFDTKGDFYHQFFKEGDIVISNDSSKFKGSNDYWNIFSELTIDKTTQS